MKSGLYRIQFWVSVRGPVTKPPRPDNQTSAARYWAAAPSLSSTALSCVRVRADTGRKMSAHKKTWSAQNIIFPKMFVHIHCVNNIIALNNSPALSPELLTDLCNGQFPGSAVRLISYTRL